MTTRRILIAAAIVFVLFGYPGFLHGQAVDELFDSRTGGFTDWGSPIFTEIWRVVAFAFDGTAGMFVLQGGLLLGGCYVLLRRALPDRSAAWGTMLVLLFPPLIVTTALIGEDAMLAGLLVTGYALVLETGRWRRAGGVALLVLACGMQEGASLAVLPLVLAVPWTSHRWRRIAVAVAVWAAILVLAFALDRVVVDSRTHRREVTLALVDLTGTIAHANVDDAALRDLHVPFAVTTQITARAKLANAKRQTDRGEARLFEPVTDENRDAVISARRTLSRAEPNAYLGHRVHEFAVLLGLRRDPHMQPIFFSEFAPTKKAGPEISHMAHHSLAQKLLIWPVRKLSKTPLFRPYLFFFLAVALLAVAVVRRHGLAATVLVSAITYELGLGVTTFDPAYSDSHWLMVATALATWLIALKPRHERVGEQAPLGVADDDRAQDG